MKELIDLYAKLVIGTFSFIGPSFTLLISIFYKALEKSKIKHQGQLLNLTLASSSNQKIKDLIKENEKEIERLDPKKQVKLLFGGLLLSLGLICFYYFQHSHFWQLQYQWIRIVSIILSLACFCHSLFILWEIFCTIIQAKSELEAQATENKSPRLKKKAL